MTKGESDEFTEWIEEDRRNRALFERLQNSGYVGNSLQEFRGYDSVEDWEKLRVRLTPRRKIGRWARVCAASVAILLCGGMVWHFWGGQERDMKYARIRTFQGNALSGIRRNDPVRSRPGDYYTGGKRGKFREYRE